MTKFGCPATFIAMMFHFHDGIFAQVQNNEFSDSFPVTNGVKQGCVLSPTQFSMMFSVNLKDAFQDGDNGTQSNFNGSNIFWTMKTCWRHG